MLIEVCDIHKSFGTNHVLRGISLEVNQGDSIVILGGSGAGKSVLLRHLCGLYLADQGSVRIDGTALRDLNKKQLYVFRRRIGMSFQEGALFDSLNTYENVAFPIRRHHRKMTEKDVGKRVQECLEMVGMPSVASLMPSEMSGGMRRRVGFARAIALKPEILLFDEPTTGLDPIMTSILGDLMVQLRQCLNTTTITITHDIKSARKIATHIAMLFQGKLIHQQDNPAFFGCEHPVVRQFIEGLSEGPATEGLIK